MIFEDTSLLLFIVLLLITLFTLLLNQNDIIHPATIFSLTMTWSVSLTLVMRSEWQLATSSSATILISAAVVAFVEGAFWCDRILLEKNSQAPQNTITSITISWKVLLCFLSIMGLFIVLSFKETYESALLLGNKNGVAGMIRTVRLATENGLYKSSRWMSYRNIFSSSFTYTCILIFFSNIFQCHESVRKNLKFLVPIIFYLPFIILSGGRMGLLNLTIYILLTGAIIYERSQSFHPKAKQKIIIVSLAAGVSFLCLFLLFGFFTGKVSLHGRSPFSIIAHYGGLSAPALSVYLNSTPLESPYIGLTTLWDIYSKLRVLGLSLPQNITFLKFVQFHGINTNVYTAMRRYIEDYGYIGMYLIMYFLGIIYTAFYRFVEYRSHSLFPIAIYAFIALPLVFSINDEIFLAHILRTSNLYQICLMYIFFKVMVRVQGESSIDG